MAIKCLNDFGYMVFVVTNQAGVARGYYNESAVNQLHQWINAELASYGGHVDAFYYCPHHPKGLIPNYCRICECRKPAPGMLLRAFREWPITRTCSFLIGDKETDIAAASAANVPGYLFDGENLFVTVRRVIHITGHNKSCASIHAKSLSGLLPGSTLKAVRGKTGQGQNG
jgi:D-glycero-D-manno-heptose 1,7-bisphosphate phosphatase